MTDHDVILALVAFDVLFMVIVALLAWKLSTVLPSRGRHGS
jgi:hypothetical protein